VSEIELGFASTKAGARELAEELGGLVKRVSDRRGWIVVRFEDSAPMEAVDEAVAG
jgi:hypothetical protein